MRPNSLSVSHVAVSLPEADATIDDGRRISDDPHQPDRLTFRSLQAAESSAGYVGA